MKLIALALTCVAIALVAFACTETATRNQHINTTATRRATCTNGAGR